MPTDQRGQIKELSPSQFISGEHESINAPFYHFQNKHRQLGAQEPVGSDPSAVLLPPQRRAPTLRKESQFEPFRPVRELDKFLYDCLEIPKEGGASVQILPAASIVCEAA